jgi:hypothetical protein
MRTPDAGSHDGYAPEQQPPLGRRELVNLSAGAFVGRRTDNRDMIGGNR